jgi:hypothetical protein
VFGVGAGVADDALIVVIGTIDSKPKRNRTVKVNPML